MAQALLDYEPIIRAACFLGVFALMAAWEGLAPRRTLAFSRLLRWPNNLGVVVLDTVVVRMLFPTAAVGMALLVEARGWGILNAVPVPDSLAVVAAIVLLDLAIYFQHVLFHAVPLLWRLHRMHHADLDVDATTGVRFHPLEIVLSIAIKFGVIVALGAPAFGVLLFEVLLNASSVFNHGNVRLHERVDQVLRWLIVTPEMHRVHHSVLPAETNSNFGFNLPWWDRLFGTYRPLPAAGHERMTIGLEQFREPRDTRLDRLLLQPFFDDAGRSEIRLPTRAPSPPTLLRIGLLALLLLAAGIALRHEAWFAQEGLAGAVERFGILAPIAFIVVYATAAVALVPGTVLALAGGALFGPLWGTVWNLLGATTGATLAFLTARYLAADLVARTAGDTLQRVIRGIEAEGWRFVAIARLVPLVPFNVLNYALGVTPIRLSHYVLATLVCMVPGAIACTYIGYAGRELALGSEGAIRKAVLAVGLLTALVLLPRPIRWIWRMVRA